MASRFWPYPVLSLIRVDIVVKNVALSRWAYATTIVEDVVATLDVMFWGMHYPTLAVLS